MPKTYYIDGYNVLHASGRLRRLVRKDFETAREALIDKVAVHCVETGDRAVIVFDGRGEQVVQHVAHHRNVRGLEVRYAPKHLSADAVIERMVYQLPERLSAVVVSNDHGLRELCRGMGALVMEAGNFLGTVRESRQSVSDTLERKRPERPAFLEDALDAETSEMLRKLKERL